MKTIDNIRQSRQGYAAWNSLQDAACSAKQHSTESPECELSASQDSQASTVADPSIELEVETSDDEDEFDWSTTDTTQIEMNMESVQHQLHQEELQQLRTISKMDAQIIDAVIASQQARGSFVCKVTERTKRENKALRCEVEALKDALAKKTLGCEVEALKDALAKKTAELDDLKDRLV